MNRLQEKLMISKKPKFYKYTSIDPSNMLNVAFKKPHLVQRSRSCEHDSQKYQKVRGACSHIYMLTSKCHSVQKLDYEQIQDPVTFGYNVVWLSSKLPMQAY